VSVVVRKVAVENLPTLFDPRKDRNRREVVTNYLERFKKISLFEETCIKKWVDEAGRPRVVIWSYKI